MSRPSLSEVVHRDLEAAEGSLRAADELQSSDFADPMIAAMSRLSLRVEALARATIANGVALAAIAENTEAR